MVRHGGGFGMEGVERDEELDTLHAKLQQAHAANEEMHKQYEELVGRMTALSTRVEIGDGLAMVMPYPNVLD